mgnify:CR=1 FL=1
MTFLNIKDLTTVFSWHEYGPKRAWLHRYDDTRYGADWVSDRTAGPSGCGGDCVVVAYAEVKE